MTTKAELRSRAPKRSAMNSNWIINIRSDSQQNPAGTSGMYNLEQSPIEASLPLASFAAFSFGLKVFLLPRSAGNPRRAAPFPSHVPSVKNRNCKEVQRDFHEVQSTWDRPPPTSSIPEPSARVTSELRCWSFFCEGLVRKGAGVSMSWIQNSPRNPNSHSDTSVFGSELSSSECCWLYVSLEEPSRKPGQ